MTSNWDALVVEIRSIALLDFASLLTALAPKNDAFKDGFEKGKAIKIPANVPRAGSNKLGLEGYARTTAACATCGFQPKTAFSRFPPVHTAD